MTKEQQLEHRLAMIMDDLSQIKRFIFANKLEHKFSEPTPMADEVWNHISNIEIACDLNTKESLRWTLFTEPNRLTDEV